MTLSKYTTCTWGHPWTEANTYTTTAGYRACRKCTVAMQKDYQRKKKGLPPLRTNEERMKARWRFAEQRFWENVVQSDDGCWGWSGKLDKGYGFLKIGNKRLPAHVFSYQLAYGEIPAGMHIDHACHTPECDTGIECKHRQCTNPAHLQVVSREENVLRGKGAPAQNARKTHCIRGHLLEGSNISVDKNGGRHCRTCNRERCRAWHANKKLS